MEWLIITGGLLLCPALIVAAAVLNSAAARRDTARRQALESWAYHHGPAAERTRPGDSTVRAIDAPLLPSNLESGYAPIVMVMAGVAIGLAGYAAARWSSIALWILVGLVALLAGLAALSRGRPGLARRLPLAVPPIQVLDVVLAGAHGWRARSTTRGGSTSRSCRCCAREGRSSPCAASTTRM